MDAVQQPSGRTVNAISWSANCKFFSFSLGKVIASGDSLGNILLSSEEGTKLHTFKANLTKRIPVNDIIFSGKSESLIYGMADGALKVWDSKEKKEIHSLYPFGNYPLKTLCLDQINNRILAIGNAVGQIGIYNFQNLISGRNGMFKEQEIKPMRISLQNQS